MQTSEIFGSFGEKVVCASQKAVDGARIISSMGENLSVVSFKTTDDRCFIDGIISADVVFKNSDNGIVATPCECPFALDFAVDGEVDCLKVVLCDLTTRVRNDEIEIEGYLKVYYNEYIKQTVECINDIQELGLRKDLDGAITICMGKKGDSLWDVAKKLGIDEQEILKYNQDIEFPLLTNDRILVYRQKI